MKFWKRGSKETGDANSRRDIESANGLGTVKIDCDGMEVGSAIDRKNLVTRSQIFGTTGPGSHKHSQQEQSN